LTYPYQQFEENFCGWLSMKSLDISDIFSFGQRKFLL
jgi:hypothetical protein